MNYYLPYQNPDIAICDLEEELILCVSGEGQNEGYEEYPINW